MPEYEILLKAEFTNIVGISFEPTFSLRLKCHGCNRKRENPVVVTADSLKIDELVRKQNFKTKCQNCSAENCISVQTKKEFRIHRNRKVGEPFEKVIYAEKIDGGFSVGTLKTDYCDAISIDGVSLTVVSNDGSKFDNVDLSLPEGNWNSKDAENHDVVISDMYAELKEFQKSKYPQN